MNKKKILIYGAGGVGGYFGGRLAFNKNNDVTFIARSNYKTLNEKGLKVKSIHGDFKTKVKVVKQVPKNTFFDLVIISVKSYDTDAVIKKLKGSLSQGGTVISIQNGIGNYDKLAKAFGKKRVLRGFCRIAAEMKPGGVVHHTAMGEIITGEENGEVTTRINNLSRLASDSGVNLKISENILHEAWIKFAWNSVFNMLTAATMLTVDKLIQSKEVSELCSQLYDEIIMAAKARKVKLTQKDKENALSKQKNKGIYKTSTYIDRSAGKPLETDVFTGEILRIASQNKLKLPINEFLYSILKAV